jgi:hypothetical protein
MERSKAMALPRYIANLAKVDRALAEEITQKQLDYAERYQPKATAAHFRKVLATLRAQ